MIGVKISRHRLLLRFSTSRPILIVHLLIIIVYHFRKLIICVAALIIPMDAFYEQLTVIVGTSDNCFSLAPTQK